MVFFSALGCAGLLGAFCLDRLSPAAWNSRNRRRMCLWSSLSKTIASDATVLSPAAVGRFNRWSLPPSPRSNRAASASSR